MLAPFALYNDALLSQVLMASTYPLEIVEAARWSQANASLKGDAAATAVAEKSWDVSVKSLVAFPAVLSQLNEHLDETQKLGRAAPMTIWSRTACWAVCRDRVACPIRRDRRHGPSWSGHNGDVYEKDLGPDTAQEAAAINVFNPDKSWDKADMTP